MTWHRTIYRLPPAPTTRACHECTAMAEFQAFAAKDRYESHQRRLCLAHAREFCGKHGLRLPTKPPQVFIIPPGTPAASCATCGDAIRWIVTPAGKRMPVNLDGTSHFLSCPFADQHRKAKA